MIYSFQNARDELSLYLEIVREVDNLAELLIRYDSSSKLVAIKYKFEQSDKNIKTDLSDGIARVEKLKERYQKSIRDCFIHLELVQDKIDKIENPLYRNVLRRKYIQGQDLKYIGIELKLNTIRKIHKKALESYSKVDI